MPQDDELTRAIPPSTWRKWRIWRNSSMGWKATHYSSGFLSTALAAMVAINAKAPFLDSTTALVLASVSAGLAFLVTTIGAQGRAKALDQAAWELEKIMAVYRTDSSVPLSELGKAEAKDIDMLKAQCST